VIPWQVTSRSSEITGGVPQEELYLSVRWTAILASCERRE